MNVEPEQRAALLGEYIAEHSATVRAAARAFGCSSYAVFCTFELASAHLLHHHVIVSYNKKLAQLTPFLMHLPG